MRSNINRPVKLLLNNRLDKEVQRIVQPFNIIDSVFFTSKYKIRNKYIYPCDKKYHILLFITITFSNMFCIFRMFNDQYHDFLELNKSILVLNTLFWFSVVMVFFSYVLLIVCNIFHSQSNVSLILSIQEINMTINISKSIQSYVIWNWISLFTVLCVHILVAVYFYVSKASINFFELSTELLVVQYDFNLVYGIRLTTLFTKYLKEWVKNISVINNHVQGDEYGNIYFKAYCNILEAYKIYSKCFRILVSVFASKIN